MTLNDTSSNGSKMRESEDLPVSKVEQSACGEWVILGGKKINKTSLVEAFAGSLEVGGSQRGKYSLNAAPWGLASLALTTFVVGLVTLHAKGVHHPNILVGAVFFCAGLGQFLAGILCFFERNTFATTALISFGAFWFSFGAVYTPSFGIMAAYAEEPRQLENAIGFFLIGWSIVTFILILVTLKSTLSLCLMFVGVFFIFFLQGIGYMIDSPNTIKSSGAFACIAGVLGWYNAFAGMATPYNSYITLKVFALSEHPHH